MKQPKNIKETIRSGLGDVERKPAEKPAFSKKTAGLLLTVISALTCVLTVVGILFLRDGGAFSEGGAVYTWIGEHWLLGSLLMVLVCALQVIVALVPGEVVEISAGLLFGWWQGLLICIVGMTLGSVLVILLVRRFGRRFVEAFYPADKIDELPILNDPAKRNLMTFLLFLIPGTPKDLLTYVVGLTRMSIPVYILLTAFARIPSVVVSTLSGDAVGQNNLLLTVLFFGISAAISIGGYFLYRVIQKRGGSANSQKKP